MNVLDSEASSSSTWQTRKLKVEMVTECAVEAKVKTAEPSFDKMAQHPDESFEVDSFGWTFYDEEAAWTSYFQTISYLRAACPEVSFVNVKTEPDDQAFQWVTEHPDISSIMDRYDEAGGFFKPFVFKNLEFFKVIEIWNDFVVLIL